MSQTQNPPASGARGKETKDAGLPRSIEDLILGRDDDDVKGNFVFEAEADAGGRIIEDENAFYHCDMCGYHYEGRDTMVTDEGYRVCRGCEKILKGDFE